MSNDSRRSLASRIASIDSAALQLRLVLTLLADENGRFATTKDDLATFMHITKPTLNKRLKAIGIEFNGSAELLVDQAPEAIETFLSGVIDRSVSLVNIDSKYTGKDVITRWSAAYKAMYDGTYRYGNFPIALNQANAFAQRYGAISLDITDFVIENYATLWRSSQFPRPTFGALMSWLGEQASEYVKKRKANDASMPARISDEDRRELF